MEIQAMWDPMGRRVAIGAITGVILELAAALR
jgi:hypothetical protein